MQTQGPSSTTPVTGAQAPAAAGKAPDQATMKKAAQAFEAIFVRQMLSSMRSNSLSEGLFDSSATEQFRDMADSRTADEMSKKGSFGIAELLLKQFAPKTPMTPGSVPAATGSAATPATALAATPAKDDAQ